MFNVPPNPEITFKVLYADDDLLVVSKPPRLPTQPGKGHEHDTLLNGLFAHYGQQLQNLGAARDFGLLHRLDKETSGLVIVGLRPRAYDALREAFAARTIKKFYWALTARAPSRPTGIIELPLIERGGGELMKTSGVSKAGKPAATAYRVLEASALGAVIEARPMTGRLHQIRVHFEAAGFPILADKFYAPRTLHEAAPRLALHAHRVVFEHPATGQTVDVRSVWPHDLRRVLARLELSRPDLASPNAQPTGAALPRRTRGPMPEPLPELDETLD